VKGVSFRAEKGEILACSVTAPASTTISLLCGLLRPVDGDARIEGHSIRHDAQAARAALGVVPQEIAIYPDLSARENLVFWGKMYGLRGAALKRRVDEVLEIIGLTDRQRARAAILRRHEALNMALRRCTSRRSSSWTSRRSASIRRAAATSSTTSKS
jgi:ABC-2 type transport system ATP-binding protein